MKKVCIGIVVFLLLLAALSLLLTVSGTRPRMALRSRVAVVAIEGILGVDVNTSSILDELKEFREDASVKAIVLRINSPGGTVAPAQEIYAAVKRVREEKQVVVSMGSLAASGGYYVAVAADRIYANPGTMTGSIGVIMEIPNVEGLMQKVGVRTEVIKSGRHKDMASMFRPMGDAERDLLQALLNDVHEQFMEAVAEGRNLPMDKVREYSDGRVFTGRQALNLGLIDSLGTLDDAVAEAGRLGGIEGEPDVITKKKPFSLRDLLRGGLADTASRFLASGGSVWEYAPKYLMAF